MRPKMLTALFAMAVLGAAPLADAGAQDLRDTLGRVLEGIQGSEQRSPPPAGYRDGDRRYEDQGYPGGERRRGAEDDRQYRDEQRGSRDERRRSVDEAERRLDERQRRLDEERRRLDRERR